MIVTVRAEFSIHGATVMLREAVAEDVPALVELLAADQLGATRDGITSQDDMRAYLRAFSVLNADPAHLLLLGANGDDVIATMQLSFLPGLARRGALRAQIEAVRVREDYRGKGIGAAMIEWAIHEAHRRGCALVQLMTDNSRDQAPLLQETWLRRLASGPEAEDLTPSRSWCRCGIPCGKPGDDAGDLHDAAELDPVAVPLSGPVQG